MSTLCQNQDFDALCARVLEWREDAVAFVRDMWGSEVLRDAQQVSILRAMSPRWAGRDADGKLIQNVAVKSGKSTGKTTAEAWLGLRWLLIWEQCKVGVTSPSGPQMESVLKPELRHWLGLMPAAWQMKLRATNDGVYASDAPSERFLEFRVAARDRPESMQGIHAPHVLWIVDEAAGIVERALWGHIEGCWSDPDAWILACSNPTRMACRFFDFFNADRAEWQRLTLSSELSSFGGKAFAERIIKKYGLDDDYTRAHVLGEFPKAYFNSMMSDALVSGAMGKEIRDEDVAHAPVIIAADTNYFGDDPSCIYLRQGLRAKWLGTYPKISTDRMAGLLARFEDEYKADAVLVDMGGTGGGGVYDCLKTMGRKPIKVWFGGAAVNDRRFMNCRVEMWWSVREWLEGGGAIPDREELKTDLTGPTYWYQAGNKVQMESKEDMRARGLASPNEGDGLVMTFLPGIRKRDRGNGDDQYTGRRERRPGAKTRAPLSECPYPER